MISKGDASAFCLVAAQVIPTLLVAHFVAKRTLPPAPPPKWRQELPAQREQIAQARQMIVEQREGIARARAEIERRRGRGGGAEHVDRERAELGRLDQRSAELDASSAAFDRLANQQAELEAKPDDPLADVWYPLMLGLVLVFGLAGESAALLGALHLHIAGRSVVLVCAVLAAIAIVLMLSLMAQAAWLRFRPGERQKTGPMWLIILLTTLTVSGVVAAVFGFGPATKPTPSPTPTAKPTSTHTLTARPTPRKSS